MDNLNIEKRKDTLEIRSNIEENTLSMAGTSYPENAMQFFIPIFEWLEEYLENNDELLLELRISYLNTSSTKCLINIFQMLEDSSEEGKNMKVVWYYKKKDYNSFEIGEEFSEDIELPFDIISY